MRMIIKANANDCHLQEKKGTSDPRTACGGIDSAKNAL